MSSATQVSQLPQNAFSGRRLRTASFWVFCGYATGQMLRLLSNLVMTRMLAPEMFGIMALANVVIAGVQMLTDMGIQKSIIQSREGDQKRFLNTAWVLQIARGACLAAIVCGFALALWLIGPGLPASSVYSHPDLPIVLCILASSLIISGFRSTKSAVANRKLHMGRLTTIELMAQICAFMTMIVWASYSPDVWALVAGTVTASIVKIGVEFLWLPGETNRFQWDRRYAGEIFHFGKWIFASSLLTYWVLNGDRIILGFDITAREMGIYSIAIFVVASVRDTTNNILQKVMYPALSRALQEGHDHVAVYYRFRLPLDFLICGLCGFLAVAGEQIIWTLYDERYSEAGMFLVFLSVGMLGDRYRGLGLYYQSQGKPKKMMPIALWRAVLFTLGLPLALHEYGFFGAVAFLGIYPILTVPLLLYLKYRAGLMRVSREIGYTAFILPGAAAGYLFNWGVQYFIG